MAPTTMARFSVFGCLAVVLVSAKILTFAREQIVIDGFCRYGIVLVKGNYSFSLDKAIEVCGLLNYTLATSEELEQAYNVGYETCRYGWTADGKYVIPRHKPQDTCAKGQIGLLIYESQQNKSFDAYCFNSSEMGVKYCNKSDVIVTITWKNVVPDSNSSTTTTATAMGVGNSTLNMIDANATADYVLDKHMKAIKEFLNGADKKVKGTSIYFWIALLIALMCGLAAAIYITVITCSRS
uniref:Lymphatic vessel endothelial hyaluronic acid receptor 1-like isoform X2 n=1 Tax=Petromyzon marinus TaxID=7757 RepID=A0AAJ7TDC5_PETMA|nr:lymphatic vessel endothelial hyaluronic acid receptor 1-like isoform X2 [Petromyzon marinus]